MNNVDFKNQELLGISLIYLGVHTKQMQSKCQVYKYKFTYFILHKFTKHIRELLIVM